MGDRCPAHDWLATPSLDRELMRCGAHNERNAGELQEYEMGIRFVGLIGVLHLCFYYGALSVCDRSGARIHAVHDSLVTRALH